MTAPTLRYVSGDERVELQRLTMSVREIIRRGKLYAARNASHASPLDDAAGEPMPTAGPFHVFLSHNWKHGQAKMRIMKGLLKEILPAASIFLE